MVYIIEHDFSNTQIQEHLHSAFDNVPIIKVENAATDESSRKRTRKRKPAKKGEQVRLLKVNIDFNLHCVIRSLASQRISESKPKVGGCLSHCQEDKNKKKEIM